MKLRLKTFKFGNVFAYGSGNVLELDQNRVTIVEGQNGAGKSSLPNAIEELLYNKNSRGIKKASVKNRYTSDAMDMYMEFDLDDNEYTMSKVTKASSKVKLTKNGEEISGHTATQTYKILEKEIGLDFATFTKLVYQSTKSSLDFLSATDANRKKFLIGLLGLEKYAAIETQLKDALKVAKSTQDKLSGSLSTIERTITANSTIPDIQDEVALPDTTIVDELVQENAELNVEKAGLASKNGAIEQARKDDHRLRTAKVDADEALENLSEVPEALDYSEEIHEVDKKLGSVNTLMAKEKSTYQTFKADAEQTECPTCGSHLDKSESAAAMQKAKERWLEYKGEREQLTERLEALKHDQVDFTKYRKYVRELGQLTKDAELASAMLDSFIKANGHYVDEEIVDIADLTAKVLENNKRIREVKDKVAEVEEFNKSVVISNAKREASIQALNSAKEQLAEVQTELAESSDEVAELDILVKAFGAKGLVAYKIESSIKVLEESLNEYLSILTDGRFALGFELSGAKLDVVIYDDGDQVEVNSLSTGQFTNVQFATLLAIRKVLSAINSVQINFMFLDEGVSFLDKERKDKLIELLLEEVDLNTFIVSHGYSHPLATPMKVVSVDRVSRIEI
ncbi:putative exonuclease subunit 2 [Vibrio phage VCPH]|nr:putative exonuclease subunit 2 [Vibrio phage VCPH]